MYKLAQICQVEKINTYYKYEPHIFMPFLGRLGGGGGGAKDVLGMYFWTADIRQNTKYVVDIVSKPNPRIVNPFIKK